MEVKSKKHFYPLLMDLKKSVLSKINESFSQGRDGVLRYQGRLCVPDVDELRGKTLEEDHGSPYSIHRSSSKMYHHLREVHW